MISARQGLKAGVVKEKLPKFINRPHGLYAGCKGKTFATVISIDMLGYYNLC